MNAQWFYRQCNRNYRPLPFEALRGLLARCLIVVSFVFTRYDAAPADHTNSAIATASGQKAKIQAEIQSVLREHVATLARTTTIQQVVTGLRAIDTSDCPTDFRVAYIDHIQAWEEIADVEQKLKRHSAQNDSVVPYLEAIVRGFMGDPFGKSDEVKADINKIDANVEAAQKKLKQTLNYVERVAITHGATMPLVDDLETRAEQGNAMAQFKLGLRYLNGQGLTKDNVEGVKWLRKAAEQGHAGAQCGLALCYEGGKGVAKNEVEAVKCYRKAAEQGHDTAQFTLGLRYLNGQGLTKDNVEGVRWLRKAAEQGHAGAQFNFGLSYLKGSGVAKDVGEAMKLFQKAAERGHAGAQVFIGAAYADGEHVAKDDVQAHKWMELAAEQGNEDAKRYLPVIEARMSKEQIDEAQRLARNFKPIKNSE
jgi:TPR repeat protein